MAYTPAEIYGSLISAGATPTQATNLTAIAGAESSYGANVVSGVNRNGSQDFGVFQINSAAWPQFGGSSLATAPLDQQSTAALAVYNQQGIGAWSTYSYAGNSYMGPGQGAYSNFLP